MQTAAGSIQAYNASSTNTTDGLAEGSLVANAVLLVGICRSLTELAVLGSALTCAEAGAMRVPENGGSSGMTAAINRMLADRQWVEDACRWSADPSHQRAARAFLDACRDAVPMEMPPGCLADPQWLMVFQSAFEVHPTLHQDADTFLRAVGLATASTRPEAPPKPAPTATKPAQADKAVDRGPWDIAFALTLIGGALRAPGWWRLGALLGEVAGNEQRRRELDAIPAWRDLASRLLASRPLRKAAKVFMFPCLAVVPRPGGSLTVALQTPAWWGMLSQALATNPQLMAIAQEVLRLAATPGSPSPAPAAPEAPPVPAYEYCAPGLELAGRGWATASIPECESARTPRLVPIVVLPAPFHRIRRRWATLPRSSFVTTWKRLEARRKQAMWMLAVQVQVLATRLGAAPNDHVDALLEPRGVVRGSERAHEDRRTGAVLAPLVEMTSRDHGADTWTRRRVPRLNSGFWRRLHASRGGRARILPPAPRGPKDRPAARHWVAGGAFSAQRSEIILETSWPDLHDATLVKIELQWNSGDVIVHVRTGHASRPSVQIMASSVRRLDCPRLHPWGSSESINEVRGPTDAPDRSAKRLEIEMQSGDTVLIEALEFELSSA